MPGCCDARASRNPDTASSATPHPVAAAPAATASSSRPRSGRAQGQPEQPQQRIAAPGDHGTTPPARPGRPAPAPAISRARIAGSARGQLRRGGGRWVMRMTVRSAIRVAIGGHDPRRRWPGRGGRWVRRAAAPEPRRRNARASAIFCRCPADRLAGAFGRAGCRSRRAAADELVRPGQAGGRRDIRPPRPGLTQCDVVAPRSRRTGAGAAEPRRSGPASDRPGCAPGRRRPP